MRWFLNGKGEISQNCQIYCRPQNMKSRVAHHYSLHDNDTVQDRITTKKQINYKYNNYL